MRYYFCACAGVGKPPKTSSGRVQQLTDEIFRNHHCNRRVVVITPCSRSKELIDAMRFWTDFSVRLRNYENRFKLFKKKKIRILSQTLETDLITRFVTCAKKFVKCKTCSPFFFVLIKVVRIFFFFNGNPGEVLVFFRLYSSRQRKIKIAHK